MLDGDQPPEAEVQGFDDGAETTAVVDTFLADDGVETTVVVDTLLAQPEQSEEPSCPAGKVVRQLLAAASDLDSELAYAFSAASRHNGPDLAEVCCAPESSCSAIVVELGGTAHRYIHWSGYGLTTSVGRARRVGELAVAKPRAVLFAPPCDADSPLQKRQSLFPG